METDERKKFALGHRERVKQKFLNTKFDNWSDYEILEFALFFALPQKDTKPIAKKLIEKFGSLKNILHADFDELNKAFEKIKGVSKHTVLFLYFLKYFSIKYSEFKVKEKEKLSSPQEVVVFLKNLMDFCDKEKMYAVFLNASNGVLDYKIISEGTVGRSAVYPGQIAKWALILNARSVIVSHNHPGGVCKPSQNDIMATQAIQKALKTIEVELLDHIIVTGSDYYSFKDNGLI